MLVCWAKNSNVPVIFITVLILILLDVGLLELMFINGNEKVVFVLILILLDVGLLVAYLDNFTDKYHYVLILILLDVGLLEVLKHLHIQRYLSLNPYSIGCWFAG